MTESINHQEHLQQLVQQEQSLVQEVENKKIRDILTLYIICFKKPPHIFMIITLFISYKTFISL